MLHRLTVYLTDFVANVKRRLPMDHTAMHDARHNAASVFGHFECDTLQTNII